MWTGKCWESNVPEKQHKRHKVWSLKKFANTLVSDMYKNILKIDSVDPIVNELISFINSPSVTITPELILHQPLFSEFVHEFDSPTVKVGGASLSEPTSSIVSFENSVSDKSVSDDHPVSDNSRSNTKSPVPDPSTSSIEPSDPALSDKKGKNDKNYKNDTNDTNNTTPDPSTSPIIPFDSSSTNTTPWVDPVTSSSAIMTGSDSNRYLNKFNSHVNGIEVTDIPQKSFFKTGVPSKTTYPYD